jgi:UPF0716 protein FxsA
VIFGGALLITPGFLSDIVGALLLIPPTRSLFRRVVIRRLGNRIVVGATRRAGAAQGEYDVEGTASEHEPPGPRRLER